MELNSEDKHRIYKEVNRIFNESESVDLVHELMFKVGEYEHKYQREFLTREIEKYRLSHTDYIAHTHSQAIAMKKLVEENESLEEMCKQMEATKTNIDCPHCGGDIQVYQDDSHLAFIRLEDKINQLEAERSEMRNKVIEEAIEGLQEVTLDVYVRRHIVQFLNSLKTKP